MLAVFSIFGILLIFGLPVFLALTAAGVYYVNFVRDIPDIVILHRLVAGMTSFPLLAIPFFILAGNLMNVGGITTRIFNFCSALVGWVVGGAAYVVVFASMLFAGMTGAAVAEAGGLGTIALRFLRQAGYPDKLSIGLIGASATIGPVIPPSLPLVIYGVTAGVSIGELFVAGFVPGVLMGLALMAAAGFFVRGNPNIARNTFSMRAIVHAAKEAVLPMLTPVIILGGILAGIVTPTEAAVAAVIYAFFLNVFVYRSMTWRQFKEISLETVEATAVIMVIAAAAAMFGWMLTISGLPARFASGILALTGGNEILVLLIITLLLLVVGLFMEAIASITILVPILLPVVTAIGVDPVHFGVIMVLNLMIGLLTPPVGAVLFVLARVANVSFEFVSASAARFIVPLLLVLLLLTFVPQIVMFAPNLFFGD